MRSRIVVIESQVAPTGRSRVAIRLNSGSVLAVRAEVGAATGDENSANGGAADQAGLTSPEIDLVFQLEKALLSGSIHIIGNRGAP